MKDDHIGSCCGIILYVAMATCIIAAVATVHTAIWVPAAIAFAGGATVTMYAPWRRAWTGIFHRLTGLHLGKGRGIDAAPPDASQLPSIQPEKPLPPAGAETSAEIAEITAKRAAFAEQEIQIRAERRKFCTEFLRNSSAAAARRMIAEWDEGDLEMMRWLTDLALEFHPDNAAILVISGWIWMKLGEGDLATEDYVTAVERSGEDDEYRFVAMSNLAFRLASEGDVAFKDVALSYGRTAHENHERFNERDSFSINYLFARLVFAEGAADLEDVIAELVDVHRRPHLTPKERSEIRRYLTRAVETLAEVTADEAAHKRNGGTTATDT